MDPFTYADGIAFQQTQGMISIGTGGIYGKGFNHLELNVPVRESDMIFTVIAEDFGFGRRWIGSFNLSLPHLPHVASDV